MQREDQTGIVGEHQEVRIHLHALFADLGDLGQQVPGIDHHAVADDRALALHQARRQQRQLVGVVAHHQRVAGVVPALEAHDHVRPIGQPVDDLALAFVAPLGADHGDIGHGYGFPPAPRVPTALRQDSAGGLCSC